MTDTQPSGVDMARAALAAARAAAKSRPVQPQKKKRRSGSASIRRAGDPMGLGAAIGRMMTERGWEPPETGGSIIDQWPSIAPELADKVAAVRFEHDTGVLHLRPATHTYATQLRLYQAQILAKVQAAPAGSTVRSLKILPAGAANIAPADTPSQPEPPREPAPIRTRDTASPGYQQARALALENRPAPPPNNPYIEEARQRQIAALRANRQPENQHRDAVWAQADAEEKTGPAAGSVEESLARARAYARQDRAGGAPRRAFDVA
ncbi:DciA family protein [Streptomyces chartreusis]|uniref:DciA family protein n=1 Tax=Streptomyces chartreusis TaxID=1969 RepID=UPI0037201766